MNTTVEADAAKKKPKFDIPKRRDTFSEWLETQKIPVVRGFYIADINDVELEYWDLKGIPASFIILDGTGGINDAYIAEIPPGGKSKPIRHIYEEMVYVTKGHGATTVWQKDGKKHTFEWGPGSLFAIPMNAYYQHFNSSGIEGARYYAVTNSCFMMNLFHNVDFIFDNEFAFTDRFDPAADDYFNGEGKIEKRLFMTTNFVPDAHAIKLYDYSERGKGGTNVKFNFAQQSMGCHISEFPVGSYKKGHKHGPGAHLIILNGKGFSTMWPREGTEPQRVEWKPRTVVVPPDQWLHQHFNTGNERARYLAMHQSSWAFKPLVKGTGDLQGSLTSVKDGGNQIEFEDEDSRIHAWFLDELQKNNAECVMCDYFPNCPKK